MTRNKISIFVGAMLILLTSCKNEDLAPIITFDQAGKGAYVRRLAETDKLINLLDVAGSTYTYSVEFVDLNKGDLVAEYIIDLVYVDNDASNGDNSVGPIEFRKWNASEFQTTEGGFKGVSNISISGPELIAAAGTTADQVIAGDQFKIDGRLVLQDGSVFGAENSSAAVNGAAFRGHFDFTLPAGCPSSLEGTYNYESSDIWCDAAAAPTGSVEFTALGGGQYNIDDWSFGGYEVCYGSGSVAGSAGLTFGDVCKTVSFTGFVDDFGDTWTFSHDITGADWSITWDNTYGESGKTVIKANGATWDLISG